MIVSLFFFFFFSLGQSPTGIGNLSRCWLSCLGPLVYLLPETFNLFSFPIFWLWTYLVKIVSERRRTHQSRYLCFYWNLAYFNKRW